MNESKYERELKQRLARMSGTNPQDWYLISRARHAMEAVLSALPTGEVITQALTCITAVNPILSAGHVPRYCDISVDRLSIDTRLLPALLSSKTRAVVLQHTLGVEADVAGARAAGAKFILEDSAHCLGYISKQDGLPIADVSVHSFGAEKILATRFGAAVWVNPVMADQQLRLRILETLEKLPEMNLTVAVRARLYPTLNGVLNHLPAKASEPARQALLKSRIFRSPIVPEEQSGANYEPPQRLNTSGIQDVLKEMKGLPANLKHRAKLTQLYLNAPHGNYTVPAGMKGTLPCVRFPLLAKTPEAAEGFFQVMRAKGYTIGKWYRPLFFPGAQSFETYQYAVGSCPVAEDVSARIINLPTGPHVSEQTAKELIDAVSN